MTPDPDHGTDPFQEEVTALRQRLAEAERAALEWRQAYQDLKTRAQEHTVQFEQTNQVLRSEVAERQRIERGEAALRASEERYRQLLERNLAGVVRSHPDGQVLECNEAFARMLGCASPAEILARPAWDSYYRAADRTAMLEQLRDRRLLVNYEFCLRRKDGKPVWVLGTVNLNDDDPSNVSLQGIYIDITERKHLEERVRQTLKMEAVGRLAGGVAHDFNNLLTVITGYSELLLETLPPGGATFLSVQEIKKAADRAARLTSQLLTFGRKQLLAPKVLDLNVLLQDMVQMLVPRVVTCQARCVSTCLASLGRRSAEGDL
jgi:PAS domain S-box-containing protein